MKIPANAATSDELPYTGLAGLINDALSAWLDNMGIKIGGTYGTESDARWFMAQNIAQVIKPNLSAPTQETPQPSESFYNIPPLHNWDRMLDADYCTVLNIAADNKCDERLHHKLHEESRRRLTVKEYIDQWHPIETAPKDEDILLFGQYLYGGDKGSTEYIYLGSWDDGAWLCDSERFTTSSFSHWMSLPKPPLYEIE